MPEQTPRSVPLGDLEVAVLEHLWSSSDGASAKQAHSAIGTSRGVTLNTVQSALERLYRKNLLRRDKQGHAYYYQPVVSRQAFLSSLINDVLGRFGSDPGSSAAAMIDAAESFDADTLDILEQAIRQRRDSGGHEC